MPESADSLQESTSDPRRCRWRWTTGCRATHRHTLASQSTFEPNRTFADLFPHSVRSTRSTLASPSCSTPLRWSSHPTRLPSICCSLADLIADFFKADRLRQLEREKELLQLSEKLLHRLSKSRTSAAHLRDLCDTFGHASQADQVFLAYRADSKSTRWTLAAISGLDEVDPRAEGTEIVQQLVANLATAEQEESSLVSSKLLSPRVGSLQREHDLDGRYSEFFRVFKAHGLHWAWIHSDPLSGQPQVAAIWIYQKSSRKLSVDQVSSLFRLGLAASQVPWYRRLIAREKPSFQRRLDPTLWQTKTKWMTAIGVLLTVAFIPIPMNVSAPATLHPSQIQNHYAPSDAIVRAIEADESGWIEAGQVFMKLEDLSLSSEIDEALGTIAKNRERITEIESRLLRNDRLPGSQRDPLESEAEMLKKSLDTQQKRLEYLMARAEKLEIRADFRSRLSHLNSKQDLTGRPVKRGQYLLSTHNPDGPWYVEARFREQDLPYLQQRLLDPASTSAVLTSQPSEQFSVTWMTSAPHAIDSSNMANEKNFVVRFAIDPTAMVEFHDGNSARIQVRCGMTPLAWVLFRDFLQSAWSKVRLWI